MATNSQEELAAFVALLRAQLLPVDRLASYAEAAGSAIELLEMARQGELAARDGSLALEAVSESLLERARSDVEGWAKAGLDVRTVFDAEYPANLREIMNRPPFVFVRGTWDDRRDSRAVAIVGARAASEEGQRRARKLARNLAEAGITVVSGLAKGIDAAAHLGALEAGGRTSAVLGHGITRIYPSEHAGLAARIVADGGALFSQFLPEQPPTQWTFPKRNVVMSGLTWATVVVEASVTSGARVQATEALRHGRTVFLLRSLVESHAWAREYVDKGKFGVRAIELAHADDLLEALALTAAG